MPEHFTNPEPSAIAAKYEAQRLAFAPYAFQAARILRDKGMLAAILASRDQGLDEAAIASAGGCSPYAARVLCEAGLAAGLLRRQGTGYTATKVAHYLVHDAMTRVNLDFMHDVCYQGAFHLEKALDQGAPAGLRVFGDWPTIYEGLSQLPEDAQRSWFAFDHFYSDSAFPAALEVVFADPPRRLLDIGGNTGRWARRCMAHDESVHVTIADLPGQLDRALAEARADGLDERIDGCTIDLLDPHSRLPAGYDAIWMSQFLCCFSEAEITSILARVAAAMDAHTRLYILDTYHDRQRFEAASYCLIMSSLYFTAMANGNSRMYRSDDLLPLVQAAGLRVERDLDDLGLSHTLFVCRRADSPA